MKERRSKDLWTAVALAVLVQGLAGCAVVDAPPELAEAPKPEQTTLIVKNNGIDAVAIYSNALNARLATVMPGMQRCVRLPNSFETLRLTARPVGGGASFISPRFEPRPGEGWSWSIGLNSIASGLSLTPSRQCLKT